MGPVCSPVSSASFLFPLRNDKRSAIYFINDRRLFLLLVFSVFFCCFFFCCLCSASIEKIRILSTDPNEAFKDPDRRMQTEKRNSNPSTRYNRDSVFENEERTERIIVYGPISFSFFLADRDRTNEI